MCDAGAVPKQPILDVIEAFVRGDKPSPRSQGRIYSQSRNRRCSTDGIKIYSYDEPIVVKLDDNTVLVLKRWTKPTSTTDKHISACKAVLPKRGFRIELVDNLREAVRVRNEKRRYGPSRPHGRCEFITRCVEHEIDPTVTSCKDGVH